MAHDDQSFLDAFAEAVQKLINSKPRSPTREELRGLMLEHYLTRTRPMTHPSAVVDDVRTHYEQRVVKSPGSNVTAQGLYDDYCDWCEEEGKNALPMPSFSRAFKAFGVRKDKLGGRVRYFDIELTTSPGGGRPLASAMTDDRHTPRAPPITTAPLD
jgi:hypothetical protein